MDLSVEALGRSLSVWLCRGAVSVFTLSPSPFSLDYWVIFRIKKEDFFFFLHLRVLTEREDILFRRLMFFFFFYFLTGILKLLWNQQGKMWSQFGIMTILSFAFSSDFSLFFSQESGIHCHYIHPPNTYSIKHFLFWLHLPFSFCWKQLGMALWSQIIVEKLNVLKSCLGPFLKRRVRLIVMHKPIGWFLMEGTEVWF